MGIGDIFGQSEMREREKKKEKNRERSERERGERSVVGCAKPAMERKSFHRGINCVLEESERETAAREQTRK
jgi:hypothetical protein